MTRDNTGPQSFGGILGCFPFRKWFRVKAACPVCNKSLLEEGIFEVDPISGARAAFLLSHSVSFSSSDQISDYEANLASARRPGCQRGIFATLISPRKVLLPPNSSRGCAWVAPLSSSCRECGGHPAAHSRWCQRQPIVVGRCGAFAHGCAQWSC